MVEPQHDARLPGRRCQAQRDRGVVRQVKISHQPPIRADNKTLSWQQRRLQIGAHIQQRDDVRAVAINGQSKHAGAAHRPGIVVLWRGPSGCEPALGGFVPAEPCLAHDVQRSGGHRTGFAEQRGARKFDAEHPLVGAGADLPRGRRVGTIERDMERFTRFLRPAKAATTRAGRAAGARRAHCRSRLPAHADAVAWGAPRMGQAPAPAPPYRYRCFRQDQRILPACRPDEGAFRR